MLDVQTKLQQLCDKNIILLFQIYLQDYFFMCIHFYFVYEKCQ